MQIHRRFAKNAVANLGRGSAAAMVALLLPPVLIRHMTSASYAVWVLALQVVSYVGYLDFGLQTAIGRYIAFANEKRDAKWRDGIFSTAFAGLVIAALLGLLLILATAIALHRIFPKVPLALVTPMRMALLIVGTSVALGLPASAWNGVFVGLQRYDVPAVTTSAGRLLSALGLIFAAIAGQSLVFMAAVIAVVNILSYALQYRLLRRIAPEIRFQSKLITSPIIRELSGYSLSLTVWSFSMLLINGFDLILVGRFQFGAVTAYSASATLITFLAGAQNAIFGVIMPHAAALQARNNSEALGNLLVRTTRFGVLLLLLTGLPLIVFAAPLIRIWIGPQFAQAGGNILIVLVIANMMRLTGAPYASILIGTGQQRLVIVSPLTEGVTNLVLSILLGLKYGAIGVAWGTLFGAIAAVLANIFYNLQRTRYSIDCSRLRYVSEAMAVPALCGIPVCLALPATILLKSNGTAIITLGWLVSFCACAIVILKTSVKDFRSGSHSTGGDREH
ncbi:MAG: polysaccharide biosynthesis C-terminal domain-containing protein [Terriglobales bacterium]|jgi:O-antigen/teichoic acid export membrane protein